MTSYRRQMVFTLSLISSLISMTVLTEDEGPDYKPYICDIGDRQFDSIFMLSDDIYFKSIGTIWKLNSFQYVNAIQMEKEPWRKAKRVAHIEKAIGFSTEIDVSKPMFAFDYQYLYKNVCNNTGIGNNLCEIHELFGPASYACFYGSSKLNPNDVVIQALTYSVSGLNRIEPQELYKKVLGYCTSYYNFMFVEYVGYHKCNKSNPITGWNHISLERDTTYELNHLFVCKLPLDDNRGKDVVIHLKFEIDPDSNEGMILAEYLWGDPKYKIYEKEREIEIDMDMTGIAFPLHFKDGVLILLNCKKGKCGLFDRLDTKTLNIFNPKINNKELSDNLSIAKILRCPQSLYEEPTVRFNPSYFCSYDSFDSIFSMGNDIYFQRNGKFWRNYDLSSTADSNPNLLDEHMNIRYDSYTTTLLKKYFNISRMVFGLTMKVPEGCDLYDLSSDLSKCNLDDKYFYYKTTLSCIFGYKVVPRGSPDELIAEAFINTPAGIEDYPIHPFGGAANSKCSAILIKFYEQYPRTLVPVSVVNNHVWHLDYPDIEWMLLFNVFNTESKTFIRKWANMLSSQEEVVENIPVIFNDMPGEFPFNSGLFFYKRLNLWIAFKRNIDMKIDINTSLYETTIDTYNVSNQQNKDRMINVTDSTHPMTGNLRQLMNCTEDSTNASDMSYSLIPLYETSKWICSPNLTPNLKVAYSVFNIGEHIYIQTDYAFHRYVDYNSEIHRFKRGFIHDKQVSELLNDIFDTSERVIGLSYLYGNWRDYSHPHNYRVILMGTPRPNINIAPGKKIIYRVFEKGTSIFSPLVPINFITEGLGTMKYPLGVVDNYCNSSDLIICSVGLSLKDIKNYDTLNGVAFLQLDKLVREEKVHDEAHDKLFPSFYSAIINTNTFTFSTDGKHLFSSPILNFPHEYMFQNVNPWKKVYGIFYSRETLYILAIDKNSNDLKVYQASEHFYSQPGHQLNPIPWDDILNDRYSKPMDNFFVCPVPNSAESSESSSPFSSWFFIFILLLISLVILVILIGFLAYKRYGSTPSSSKPVLKAEKSSSDGNAVSQK